MTLARTPGSYDAERHPADDLAAIRRGQRPADAPPLAPALLGPIPQGWRAGRTSWRSTVGRRPRWNADTRLRTGPPGLGTLTSASPPVTGCDRWCRIHWNDMGVVEPHSGSGLAELSYRDPRWRDKYAVVARSRGPTQRPADPRGPRHLRDQGRRGAAPAVLVKSRSRICWRLTCAYGWQTRHYAAESVG